MKTMRFQCDSIDFLGVGVSISWEEWMTQPVEIWKHYYENQTMERLLQVTQAKKVYGLFGLECDSNRRTVSYHIVCENISQASSDEFEQIHLEASKYIAFEEKGIALEQKQEGYEIIYDEIYKQWMPSSNYEAIVTPYEHRTSSGLAIVESFTPFDCNSSNYTLEVWVPVKKSE